MLCTQGGMRPGSTIWPLCLIALTQGRESEGFMISKGARNHARYLVMREAHTRRQYQAGVLSSILLGGLLQPPQPARADQEAELQAQSRLLERLSDLEIKNPGMAGFGSPTLIALPR